MLAAANNGSDTVSMYSAGPSGALAAESGSPVTIGAPPTSVVFSPSGELLAVTAGTNVTSDTQSLYMFSVSATGALTPVPGSPYSVGSNGQVAFSPTGGLLAVPTSAGVGMFSVSSSGALAPVSGSPFAIAAKYGQSAAFAGGGSLLRVAAGGGLEGAELLTTYSVASSGALTPIGSAEIKDVAGGYWFSPDGSMVASPGQDSSNVFLDSIGPSDALSEVQSLRAPDPVVHIAFSASGAIATESIEGDGLEISMPSSTSASTNWVGAFGSEGYDLAAWNGESDLSDLPDASVSIVKGGRCTWAANTSNVFALTSPDGSTRKAAGYCNPEGTGGLARLGETQVKLTFNAAYTGDLRVYSMLWEGAQNLEGKPHEVIAAGGQGVQLSNNPDMGSGGFSEGGWALFHISEPAGGSLTISGQVLSGIFLGDAGSPPPTVTTAPEGSWAGTYGSTGYDLADWDGAVGDVSDLPNATVNLQQGSRYQWAANTTDTRALEDPGAHIRNAATYYDPNEIKLKLSFPAAYTGNLHLYAVDWDSQGRTETISVNGKMAEPLSNFTNGAWVSFPISVAAGGTVTITVNRLAGPNAVLSGIFLGEGGSPPTPTVANAPEGSWAGTFGSTGYDLADWDGAAGDVSDTPNATVNLQQGSRYQWAANTTDTRALEDPGGNIRNAATYYDPNEIKLSLSFPAAYTGNLHLYAVDWDSQGRREAITVNGQSGVLSSEFTKGAWITFPINVGAGGTVTITVTRLAGANAVLSGIFLGEGGSPPTPTTSPEGSWAGTYGSEGYDLADWDGAGDVSYLPGATLGVVQGSRYQWAANTTDTRALEDPGGHIRNAATYYDPNEIKLSLSFPAAYTGTLRLYAVDWDSQGRREVITVNGQSAVLSSGFSQGAWVAFPINVEAGGTVTIAVNRLAGPNAVLSGVFLGTGGPPAGPTVGEEPQGSWTNTSGSAGYVLAGWNGSTDLTSLGSGALTVERASRYTWAGSTTDVRALESPTVKGARTAATYYDPNEIKLSLRFPGAYTGNLHLYAVDWDSQGRREVITVNGQSAVLSSDFTNGAWVTFPISVAAGGTVTITVTRTAGSNAVLSGIFLGEGSSGWPQAGGDAGHSGYNPQEHTIGPSNVASLSKAWSSNPALAESNPQLTISAGPIVDDGVAYVVTKNGWGMSITTQSTLYAYPAACASTGGACQPLWKATIADHEGLGGEVAAVTGIAAENGMVFVSRNNYPSPTTELYAFSASCASAGATCSPLWTASSSTAHSLPLAVAGGYVYWGPSTFSRTCASGGATCQPLQTVALPKEAEEGAVDEIAVGNELVFLTVQIPTGSDSFGDPIYSTQIRAYPQACLASSSTCTPAWTSTVPASSTYGARVTVVGGQLFASYWNNGELKLAAFSTSCATGGGACSPTWTAQVAVSANGFNLGVAVAGGVVYQAVAGTLYAYSTSCASGGAECSPLWTGALPTPPPSAIQSGASTPAVANGLVYVAAPTTSDRLELRAFPTSCTQGVPCAPLLSVDVGSLPAATGLFVDQPAIADGRVFLGYNQSDSEAQNRFNFDSELDAMTVSP